MKPLPAKPDTRKPRRNYDPFRIKPAHLQDPDAMRALQYDRQMIAALERAHEWHRYPSGPTP